MEKDKRTTEDLSSVHSTDEPLDPRMCTVAKDFKKLSVLDLPNVRPNSPAVLGTDNGGRKYRSHNKQKRYVLASGHGVEEEEGKYDVAPCNQDGDITGTQWCRYNSYYQSTTNDDSSTNTQRLEFELDDRKESDNESANITPTKRSCLDTRQQAEENVEAPMGNTQERNENEDDDREVDNLARKTPMFQSRMMTLARRSKYGSRNQSASEFGSTNRSFPRLCESPKEQTASKVRLTRRQHENSERRNANMSHYGRRADEEQTEIGEMRGGRRQLGRLEVSIHTATVETCSQLERNEARMKMVSMLRDCPTWQKKPDSEKEYTDVESTGSTRRRHSRNSTTPQISKMIVLCVHILVWAKLLTHSNSILLTV
jgi:hypothetical protein